MSLFNNESHPSLLLQPLVKRGLIAFIMAGDPDPNTAMRVALALIDEGVVALEIGLPFSDPVADGPTIQASAGRALKAGTTMQSTLQFVADVKRQRPSIPIILFTYLNPILKLGVDAFAQLARRSGVDATLVVDLPLEESAEHLRAHREAGLGTIFLASPNTQPERMYEILRHTTGFIYAISRAGTTGAHAELSITLAGQIAELKRLRYEGFEIENQKGVRGERLPIAVGFGISTPAQAAEVSRMADQVVIGSRIVSLIHESANPQEAEARVRAFTRECVQAIRDIKGP